MEIDQFINQIIDEKGIKGLTPEARETVVGEMKSALMTQINRAILMELPDEKLDELNSLMDTEGFGDKAMSDFILNSGVNITKIATETMIKFRAFYLGGKEA